MALVKKSRIAADAEKPATLAAARGPVPRVVRKPHSTAGSQTIAERLAAATEELASGLAQAAVATEELGRSMEQIAGGAEQAAGASQEQSNAIRQIVGDLSAARTEADESGRRCEVLLAAMLEAGAQIGSAVRAIERNAERHVASAELISELERRARDIGEITEAVSRISDQTNLLALNAAIEAARAGEQGRGFAVVADEVRSLAETSDKSAQEVQQLAETIKTDVVEIVNALTAAARTATEQAKAAGAVIEALDARRTDIAAMAQNTRDVLTTAVEAEVAAVEVGKGAEQIASAAEEQAAGAEEAQTAIQQQAKSLDQSAVAARALAKVTEQLGAAAGAAADAEQISSSAEELSATIQELSSAASEVMAAVEEINRACQMQASATEQTSTALAQIERTAKLAQRNGQVASDRVQTIESALKQAHASVDGLIEGVSVAMQSTQASLATVARLEVVGRKIEKIIGAISLITVQTSMLAVSGAVEAARAGDSGHGFAVVSSDIRDLAREASENIEQAKDTVRGILDQLQTLRREMEQIIISTEVEVQNNRTVSALLQKVAVEIDALATAGKVIVERSQTILQSAVDAATGARQIAAAAEEASNASRQAATAATEQSQSAEDLAAAIEEIASLADELKHQDA
jgi:methyl-accepting chemotaxis protein